MRLAAIAAAVLVAGGCNPFRTSNIEAVPVESVRSILRNASNQTVGEATLRQTPHGVLIVLELTSAPPGTHAFHIHETGQCAPDFDAAGGHFNPGGREHGYLNEAGHHVGDLPNLNIPETGRQRFDTFIPNLRLIGEGGLLDSDSSALMIHAFADDYRTDPTGGAGERIICGVVGR